LRPPRLQLSAQQWFPDQLLLSLSWHDSARRCRAAARGEQPAATAVEEDRRQQCDSADLGNKPSEVRILSRRQFSGALTLVARVGVVDGRADMINGEKLLVARHSAFRPIRLTENVEGLRILRFGAEGASQSIVKVGDPRHLELPYTRLLPACLAFIPNPARVLVVGLGGGTLPRFFHAHFPEMQIDVVEIDADVVNVAREHCGFAEDARLRVIVDDGRDFIETCAGGYDVIVLDSFDADSIPPHLATLEFLGAVRKALSPEGVVVANVWGRTFNPIYAEMLLTYRAAFAEVYILDVPAPGTKLFVALSKPRVMTREELVEKAGAISRERGFDYDLGAAIAGFRNAELESVRSGEVLRD